MSPTAEFITDRELISWLKIGLSTAQGWRYRGLGPPFIRIGKRQIRYRTVDVQAWLDAQPRGCVAPAPTPTMTSDEKAERIAELERTQKKIKTRIARVAASGDNTPAGSGGV